MAEFKNDEVENLWVWMLLAAFMFLFTVSLLYQDYTNRSVICLTPKELTSAGILIDTSHGKIKLDCPVE